MTAWEIGVVVAVLAGIYLVTRTVAAMVAPAQRRPADVRRQRRREMLLTFSPGEWVWVVGSMTAIAVLLLLTLR